MVSDLAWGIERILPFATHVLEDVLYDETELLDEAVRKLYDIITDTAEFIVGYPKRSPISALCLLWCCSAINRQVGRAAKLIISVSDRHRIEGFQGAFGKLKEDFDRAVDVAALRMARRNGKF